MIEGSPDLHISVDILRCSSAIVTMKTGRSIGGMLRQAEAAEGGN
ncbi:hypothetical protein [Aquabacter sp. CN5-332]